MIDFAPRAARRVEDLRQHYEQLGRPEAICGLISALEFAWQFITTNTSAGLPKTQGADIGLVKVRRSAKLIRIPNNVPAFE